MLLVDEALQAVLASAEPLAAKQLAIREALGLRLSEDISSDVDSPPYDKSMVDGYAVIRSDLSTQEVTTLKVLEEVTAGRTPTQVVVSGSATRIMTGAPIPDGADAVVMVESTQLLEDSDQVVIERKPLLPESGNILPRGTSMRNGQNVLQCGHNIGPAAVGLMAEVGRSSVRVAPRPRVAVIATGDELVEPGEPLRPGMIRNSNGPMLDALVRSVGAEPVGSTVARDTLDSLQAEIEVGLRADLMLLSGGVSAGVLDLAPQVLSDCGVEQVFHKVKVKPGKPLWFGVKRHADRHPTLVFGLPGNPVSSLVGFLLFAAPAIQRLAGDTRMSSAGGMEWFLNCHGFESARLTSDFHQRGDRPTFFPATLTTTGMGLEATPLNWRGSADLCTLAQADSLLCFPAGEADFPAGSLAPAMRFRWSI